MTISLTAEPFILRCHGGKSMKGPVIMFTIKKESTVSEAGYENSRPIPSDPLALERVHLVIQASQIVPTRHGSCAQSCEGSDVSY